MNSLEGMDLILLLFSYHPQQCLISGSSSIFVELKMNQDRRVNLRELRKEKGGSICAHSQPSVPGCQLRKKNQILALLAKLTLDAISKTNMHLLLDGKPCISPSLKPDSSLFALGKSQTQTRELPN